jgi:class 3 adenylate cyclase
LLNQLHLVGTQLRTYSEWLLGKTLLHRAISDRTVLAPERRERSIMFADIRGFTAWSEMRTPEEVLAMLDHFYQAVETSLMGHEVIKLKYTADEAMVVFANPRTAAIVTLALRDATMTALKPHGLGVGIGLHSGPVIEGLVGGSRHKSFDVLGDTANTAKRICDHATTGEVLISYVFYTACAGKLRIGDERSARAKGKSSALLLSPLAGVLD